MSPYCPEQVSFAKRRLSWFSLGTHIIYYTTCGAGPQIVQRANSAPSKMLRSAKLMDIAMSERDYFLKAYKEFQEKHQFVWRISKVVGKPNFDERRAWASLVLMRLFMTGNSVLSLCIPEMHHQRDDMTGMSILDDSSIASLCRSLLETWLLFAYVSDPAVAEDEWVLRRMIMELYDCTARYRILEGIGDKKKELHQKREMLKRNISVNPEFRKLDAERQKAVLGCQEMYLRGKRAVVREAGWNVKHFNSMYGLLSNHAHPSLLSFPRTLDNPEVPAVGFSPDSQYITAGVALEYATPTLGFACERMFHLYPELFLATQTKH